MFKTLADKSQTKNPSQPLCFLISMVQHSTHKKTMVCQVCVPVYVQTEQRIDQSEKKERKTHNNKNQHVPLTRKGWGVRGMGKEFGLGGMEEGNEIITSF